MSRLTRWVASVVTAITAVPAGYAASVLICEPSAFGMLLAITNTLALIP